MNRVIDILIVMIFCCCGNLFAQHYRIGDLYTAPDGSQGIVYYVFPDNSGGWVVALNDASAGCTWGAVGDVPGLANQSSNFYQTLLNDTAGYVNTQILRNYQNNNPAYAAGKVDFAHGWVLPSPAQLSMLFGQLPFITSALTGAGGSSLAGEGYWCSAETDASNAWRFNFNYGYPLTTSKTGSYRVRAVRSFSSANESPEPAILYSWSTGATTSSITETPAQTTTYTVTVTAPDGSSGTAVQTVVVNSPEPQTFYDETCQGETYNNNGFTLTAAETSTPGVHTFTRTVEVDGCSTIHTLHLTVTPAYNVSDSRTVCPSALPYVWNGVTFNEAGTQSVTLNAANGCDSIMTLNLTVTPTPEATVTATSDTICVGNSVILQAQLLNADASQQFPSVAVGDILCTDNSIVKPSAWPVAGKMAMGIVFYVDNTGEHGWAVNLQNESSYIRWSGYNIDIPSLTNVMSIQDAMLDLDGYSNTQNIRAAGDASQFPFAYAVDFANNWYVPAEGQLRILYSSMMLVNNSLQIVGEILFPTTTDWRYWSSTECDGTTAWFVGVNGTVFGFGKNSNMSLRSVRNF